MRNPTACLLIIGNEILSGRTQDKNLAWLGDQLNQCGIRLMEARVIPDVEDIIVETLNEVRSIFTYVFTTGGIGPTHDDITSACVAKAFGVPLVRDPAAEALLIDFYPPEKLNEARLKMADIPEGATLVANPVSTAPGFRMENVYVFAGVPNIMQAMFANIRGELHGGVPMESRTISAFITEGAIAGELGVIQARYPGVEIGSYPFYKEKLGTSLVARSTNSVELEKCYREIKAMVAGLTHEIIEES